MAKILVAQAEPATDAHGTEPVAEGVNDAHASDSAGTEHAATDTHGETHEGTVAHADDGAHSAAFPPFDPSTFAPQLLWLAITFAALYLLMSRVALPRIGDILEVRRDRVEGDLAEAERMRQKTDQALADYEKALADAKSKAQGIAEETRAKVKADLEKKRQKTEANLGKKIAEAEAKIRETKTEALGNVGEIATETAQSLVSQLIGKVPVKTARDAVAKAAKEQA